MPIPRVVSASGGPLLLSLLLALAPPAAAAGRELALGPFRLRIGPEGIGSLRREGDSLGTEFVREGRSLGAVIARFRSSGGKWLELSGAREEPAGAGPEGEGVVYSSLLGDERGLRLRSRFRLEGAALSWQIALENRSGHSLEVGDLAIPLPMNTHYPKAFAENKGETFRRRVFRHAFIGGHGSFLFWLPVGGEGSFLLLTPAGRTALEYFTETRASYAHGGGEYTVYLHSGKSGAEEKRGTWRQGHTSLTLKPGEKAEYGFRLRWAASYREVRDLRVEEGGVDVEVIPGMVVPRDLEARIALRSRARELRLQAEFPAQTRIEAEGRGPRGARLYRLAFSRLGENLVTVQLGGGRRVPLEFFVTAPLEVLIQKRARFIATRQQHREPEKWYDGLFSLWDARLPAGRNLLGPDNLAGQHPYAVSGSDDPCNSKSIYLSQKNVAYPDAREIEVLEYFLERFVWGKHQRTDREKPHPYGIYGCDSWHACRLSPVGLGSGGHGQERMWRTFDYTTYFALYYNMYRIARQRPDLVHYLDAAGYLERAFGTARAYFTVPYSIRMDEKWSFHGWCDWAYKIGNFHEKYLLEIIAALEEEGRRREAAWLRGEWEKKVKYFLYDDPYPFISEMPVDSTAYESAYAIARYALEHGLEPDEKLWRDKNSGKWYSHPRIDPARHREFLQRQLRANLACRGWLETSYYHLGSDFRGRGSGGYTLSYMSQMGGWAILDQALRFEKEPAELLRLGYAAMLSSWALVNGGERPGESGFWHPEPRHDGAAGWGFEPRQFGADWNAGVGEIPRGPWPVDGEIDHGFTAGVEAACTVVYRDPIFGRVALGGTLLEAGDGEVRVVPRDGVRQRLWFLQGDRRLALTFRRDGFAAGAPVRIAPSLARIAFELEDRGGGAHSTRLQIEGLPPGRYRLRVAGHPEGRLAAPARGAARLELPVEPAPGKASVAVEIEHLE